MAPLYRKAQIASNTRMIPSIISTTAENINQPERFTESPSFLLRERLTEREGATSCAPRLRGRFGSVSSPSAKCSAPGAFERIPRLRNILAVRSRFGSLGLVEVPATSLLLGRWNHAVT